MATLAELRDKVRTQTETTESELPNTTIDSYLQEAFNRTLAAENLWPFLEKTWSLTMLAGNDYIAMPTDAHAPGIVSLYDANDQHRLTLIDYEYAEDLYSGLRPSVRNPVHFSVWTNVIYLWPSTTYTADRTYRMRGYRKTTDWIASGASSSPDCDVRLHLPLAHYATALAYLQQEDEQLEQVYMNRWQRDVEMARQVIMDPSQHRPLVMGPRIYTRIGNLNRYQPSFIIDAP